MSMVEAKLNQQAATFHIRMFINGFRKDNDLDSLD